MKIAILTKKDLVNSLNMNKGDEITIFHYEDIYSTDFNTFKSYDYIIILNILCYINIPILIKYLSDYKPNYCSIPSYWGLGSSNISIIHKSIFSNFKYESKINNLSSPEDNILAEIFLKSLGGRSFKWLLKLNNKTLKYLYHKYKIHNIYKKIYSINKKIGGGHYHLAIFIHNTDDYDYFSSWIKEYASKQKLVFINNKKYQTLIGITFFVINSKHIALIGENNIYYWSKQNIWKKIISNKYKYTIIDYIRKHAPLAYKTLKLQIDHL